MVSLRPRLHWLLTTLRPHQHAARAAAQTVLAKFASVMQMAAHATRVENVPARLHAASHVVPNREVTVSRTRQLT